eukprot:superscaffoldBa00010940_g24961
MSSQKNNSVCSTSQTKMEQQVTLLKRKIEQRKKVLRFVSESRQRKKENLLLQEQEVSEQVQNWRSENQETKDLIFQTMEEITDLRRCTDVHVECAHKSYNYVLHLYETKALEVKQLQEELGDMQEESDNLQQRIQEVEFCNAALLQETVNQELNNAAVYVEMKENEDEDLHMNPDSGEAAEERPAEQQARVERKTTRWKRFKSFFHRRNRRRSDEEQSIQMVLMKSRSTA